MYTISELDKYVENGLAALNLRIEPKELYEPIEYMISIGGKRLRPELCLLTYNLFSDKIEKPVLYPALALEIFHGFTLIHDDIMDQAGLPLIGVIPEDPNVTLAAAFEKPLLKHTKRGAAAACRRIAKRVQGLSVPIDL